MGLREGAVGWHDADMLNAHEQDTGVSSSAEASWLRAIHALGPDAVDLLFNYVPPLPSSNPPNADDIQNGPVGNAEAVKNLPSGVRTRACARSLKALAATMGISPELAMKVVEAIRADAAMSKTGKTMRTARVLARLKELNVDASAAAIKILAGAIGIEPELGSEPGSGVGRPKNSRDRQPRKPRPPDPRRPSRGDDVRRLRAEHPEWTLEQIGIAVGGMSKTGVSKHLGTG